MKFFFDIKVKILNYRMPELEGWPPQYPLLSERLLFRERELPLLIKIKKIFLV